MIASYTKLFQLLLSSIKIRQLLSTCLVFFWISIRNWNFVVNAYAPLKGVKVTHVSGPSPTMTDTTIDIGEWLSQKGTGTTSSSRSMIVFGTYAADFNAIEYGQRLRYYWPQLQTEKKIDRCAFLLNCNKDAAIALKQYIDLQDTIEIWIDPNNGQAGRIFGVERGWIPDNTDVNPFIKLFGMLWGLGAWATLPAVIGGYIGNPFVPQPWITDALLVGNKQNRWPTNALDISEDGLVVKNKFDELPIVGQWKRRPLELATLRLQSMIGISLAHWKELAPDQEALDAGVLTQLGGCLIVESTSSDDADGTSNTTVLYEWKDPGICAVANFEDILRVV